jgi:hypothetical protein
MRLPLLSADPYHCLQCQDGRWVCSDHPAVAWDEGKGCCGAEGVPCPACNPLGEMPPGFVTLVVSVCNACSLRSLWQGRWRRG